MAVPVRGLISPGCVSARVSQQNKDDQYYSFVSGFNVVAGQCVSSSSEVALEGYLVLQGQLALS